jgi:hypothetical protein
MEVKDSIHLQGYLQNDSDGIRLKGSHESIAMKIAYHFDGEDSKHQPEDDGQTVASLYIPNVFVRVYLSDNDIPLEEAMEKQVLNTMGALDVYGEWYGYSEWTIMGYDVHNFTIGNHDLEQILSNYNGKYVHIVVETFE